MPEIFSCYIHSLYAKDTREVMRGSILIYHFITGRERIQVQLTGIARYTALNPSPSTS